MYVVHGWVVYNTENCKFAKVNLKCTTDRPLIHMTYDVVWLLLITVDKGLRALIID